MSKNRLSDTQAYSLSQNILEFIERVTKEIIVSCMHIPNLKTPTEDNNNYFLLSCLIIKQLRSKNWAKGI